MKVIVDRIEEEYVICELEDRTIIQILKNKISFKVKEKDVLDITDMNNIYLDKEATKKRKLEIKKIIKNLWEN